jgi:hypothetical protein
MDAYSLYFDRQDGTSFGLEAMQQAPIVAATVRFR